IAAVGEPFPGVGYDGAQSGVYRLHYNQRTMRWDETPVNSPNLPAAANIERVALTADHRVTDNPVVYAAISRANAPRSTLAGVYQSTDQGKPVTPRTSPLQDQRGRPLWKITPGKPADELGGNPLRGQGYYDLVLTINPSDPRIVYLGGAGSSITSPYKGGAVLRSTDAGAHRTGIDTLPGKGGAPHPDNHAFLVTTPRGQPNPVLLDGTDGGIFQYNPTTNVWTDLNSASLSTHLVMGVTSNGVQPGTKGSLVSEGSQDNGPASAD